MSEPDTPPISTPTTRIRIDEDGNVIDENGGVVEDIKSVAPYVALLAAMIVGGWVVYKIKKL